MPAYFCLFADNTRLGVYMLSGELQHRGLLRFALSAESYTDTLVMLVASMHQPWNVLDSLQRWAGALSTHIDRLKLKPDVRQQAEQACEYISPFLLPPPPVS